jgi:hypothetical protein
MTNAQCEWISRVKAIPLEVQVEPIISHLCYVELDGVGRVHLNDPNTSSMQVIESVYREAFDPDDAIYPRNLSPEGWCQTWSWFELECVLMGMSGLHNELSNFFWVLPSATRPRPGVLPDSDMPPCVRELVDALSPSHVRIGEVVEWKEVPYRVISYRRGNTVDLVRVVDSVRACAPWSELVRPHRGEAGFGLVLTEFVHRLAARYSRMPSNWKEFSQNNGSMEALISEARERHVRPPVSVTRDPIPTEMELESTNELCSNIERVLAAWSGSVVDACS